MDILNISSLNLVEIVKSMFIGYNFDIELINVIDSENTFIFTFEDYHENPDYIIKCESGLSMNQFAMYLIINNKKINLGTYFINLKKFIKSENFWETLYINSLKINNK